MLGFGKKKTFNEFAAANKFAAPGGTSIDPSAQSVVGSKINSSVRQEMSVLSHLDARMNAVLHQATAETTKIMQPTIEPVQLFLGVMADSDILALFSSVSATIPQAVRELENKQQKGTFSGQPTLGEKSKIILEKAYEVAKNNESDFVRPEDLLSVFLDAPEVASFLKSHDIDATKIADKLNHSSGTRSTGLGATTHTLSKRTVLDKYGTDITQKAQEGGFDPIIGRDKEIERVIHILLRRSKNNPILIGDAGVGKTAIVEGLAQAIVKKTAPQELLDKRIIQLDVSSLVAGASHRGEFEERLRDVITQVQNSEGKIILFIDEIHTLMGAGDSGGPLDASNIIKPFLARGQLQVIGTTTTAEFRRYFEKDKAFERRFQPVMVEEPSEEVAIQMLQVLQPKYEKFHNVVMSPEAIEAAVHLSKKYIGERFLPDKAVDLLDEAGAGVRLEQSLGKRTNNTVTKEDIEHVVSSWTGIPITKLTEDESKKLLHMEDLIHNRVIGQELAIKAVSQAVRRGRIGLASANRPIASFIFLGPTGTGKTELAKTLAEILFGRDDALIRMDMSEYMEKHEVAKLIGAPPGYVGYEEGGQLTEAVRKKPYSVVLFDEIEKAHPDVFNILLQLLEDGRLTDNKGNTISFKNTIIIATSNIGSDVIQKTLQEDQAASPDITMGQLKELSKVIMVELRKFFKPEVLNRFDEIVIFEPLKLSEMLAIAKLRLGATKKMLGEQNIDIDLTDRALAQLAQEGYDPLYGARPLRRLVQTAIENPIAVMLIQKAFVPGDKIIVDYDSTQQAYTFGKNTVGQPVQPVESQPMVPATAQQPAYHPQHFVSDQVGNQDQELPIHSVYQQPPIASVPDSFSQPAVSAPVSNGHDAHSPFSFFSPTVSGFASNHDSAQH